MASNSAATSVVTLLALFVAGVVGTERQVTDALLNEILQKGAKGITAEMTKKIHVTKIEMLASNPTRARHWSAKITTDNKNENQKILVAAFLWEFPNEKRTGETIETYADYFTPQQNPHVDLTVPAAGDTFHEKGHPGTKLTLERLLKCIFTNNLKPVKGKCVIYVYRMLHFVTGTCACGECVSGNSHGNDPLKEMKAMLPSDPLFKDNESFKNQIENDTWDKE